jgi:hypothetical protein
VEQDPFLLTNLSDPSTVLFFAATVVEVASGFTALLAGIAATVHNYHGRRAVS